MCQWELSLSHLSLGDFESASACYHVLKEVRTAFFQSRQSFLSPHQESNWSKACYAYAEAVTLYETGRDTARVDSLMASVTGLMQRIAGRYFSLGLIFSSFGDA
jgi:hypothetical protein